jgi:hypothetical protein
MRCRRGAFTAFGRNPYFFASIVAFFLTTSRCEVYSYVWSELSLMSASSELEPGVGRRHSLVPRGGEGTAWQGLFPLATGWGLTRLWSGAQGGQALALTVGELTTG